MPSGQIPAWKAISANGADLVNSNSGSPALDPRGRLRGFVFGVYNGEHFAAFITVPSPGIMHRLGKDFPWANLTRINGNNNPLFAYEKPTPTNIHTIDSDFSDKTPTSASDKRLENVFEVLCITGICVVGLFLLWQCYKMIDRYTSQSNAHLGGTVELTSFGNTQPTGSASQPDNSTQGNGGTGFTGVDV